MQEVKGSDVWVVEYNIPAVKVDVSIQKGQMGHVCERGIRLELVLS